jgi:ABC-type polar amino acid transport system ATPase subunit
MAPASRPDQGAPARSPGRRRNPAGWQAGAIPPPIDARAAGIETVYQTLAMSPALSITDNMFMGRELRKPGFRARWLRQLDHKEMEQIARDKLSELGLMTIQNINQAVETLSGGQRQGVAVARAAAFGSKVVIMDEPTAALGVKESRRVLELITDVKRAAFPIVLISTTCRMSSKSQTASTSTGSASGLRDQTGRLFHVGRRRDHDRCHGSARRHGGVSIRPRKE